MGDRRVEWPQLVSLAVLVVDHQTDQRGFQVVAETAPPGIGAVKRPPTRNANSWNNSSATSVGREQIAIYAPWYRWMRASRASPARVLVAAWASPSIVYTV